MSGSPDPEPAFAGHDLGRGEKADRGGGPVTVEPGLERAAPVERGPAQGPVDPLVVAADRRALRSPAAFGAALGGAAGRPAAGQEGFHPGTSGRVMATKVRPCTKRSNASAESGSASAHAGRARGRVAAKRTAGRISCRPTGRGRRGGGGLGHPLRGRVGGGEGLGQHPVALAPVVPAMQPLARRVDKADRVALREPAAAGAGAARLGAAHPAALEIGLRPQDLPVRRMVRRLAEREAVEVLGRLQVCAARDWAKCGPRMRPARTARKVRRPHPGRDRAGAWCRRRSRKAPAPVRPRSKARQGRRP